MFLLCARKAPHAAFVLINSTINVFKKFIFEIIKTYKRNCFNIKFKKKLFKKLYYYLKISNGHFIYFAAQNISKIDSLVYV